MMIDEEEEGEELFKNVFLISGRFIMGKEKAKKPKRDKKKVFPNEFDEIDKHLADDGYEMDSIDEAKKNNK